MCGFSSQNQVAVLDVSGGVRVLTAAIGVGAVTSLGRAELAGGSAAGTNNRARVDGAGNLCTVIAAAKLLRYGAAHSHAQVA